MAIDQVPLAPLLTGDLVTSAGSSRPALAAADVVARLAAAGAELAARSRP
jgi:hypothetical protein